MFCLKEVCPLTGNDPEPEFPKKSFTNFHLSESDTVKGLGQCKPEARKSRRKDEDVRGTAKVECEWKVAYAFSKYRFCLEAI